MTRAEELEKVGYPGSLAEFEEIITDAFVALFPSWSVDELLLHPREAIKLCGIVQKKANLILATLLTNRKRPD